MKCKLVMMTVCAFVLFLVVGCSQNEDALAEDQSNSNSNNSDVDPYDFSEHLTISFLTTGSPIQDEDNAIFDYIEEKFNITMEWEYYDRDNFGEYFNTLVASGNVPDVWRFGYNEPNEYHDWAERGVLYDVKPLLDDYPALKSDIPTEAWEMLNPSGHYYGVPEYRLQTRNMLAIRQDWLDNLGLDVPDTIDDFYEVAYAFAHDDPNQTGQDDTVGFSAIGLFDDVSGTAWRGGAFGLARDWMEVDGELVPYQAQTEELEEYIAFMRKAYEEDVLDKDFMLHTDWRDANELLSNGVAGIEYVNPNSVDRKEAADIKEHNPEASLTYFPPPAGPDGERTTPTRPSYFKKVINADISEEKVRRILALFEWNITEGYEITRHGLEDIHWQEAEDGTIEVLDKWDEDEPASIGTNILRAWNPLHRAYWWLGDEFATNLENYYEMNETYLWESDNPGLVSETNLQSGTQLDAELEQILTEIVVGRRELSDVKTAVDHWLSNGGQQIIDEMNEQYKEYQQN
ncbi:extracellular solute-binding protein [Gracilibacillus sp. HCP3S3_G5_1]|uniref:extracellular solute-binding protein n=1 Tax=unclassified Gracilibacillus TaxID=2625209 RepID=UPI003F8CDA5C